MPISAERFGRAVSVIEHGVEAATACRKCGDTARETVDMLTSGFEQDELSSGSLLELLGTAVVMLALSRSKETTDA